MYKKPCVHEMYGSSPTEIEVYSNGNPRTEYSPEAAGDSFVFRYRHLEPLPEDDWGRDDDLSSQDYDAACDYLSAAVEHLAELEPDEITEILSRFSLAAKDGARADWIKIADATARAPLF